MTYLNKKSVTTEEETLMRHLENRIDELAQQQESMERERTILLAEARGVDALANKKTEPLTKDIYSAHTLADGTRTGEQRHRGAQKSEARLNFEKKLADVGKLQEEYLAAYDAHFQTMSYGGKKWNTILEGFGIRSKDKVRALKKERVAFRDAQTSLTEDLKRNLIEDRGFTKDQAERVAKKYVEKVLTIDNVSYEQQKLLVAREKAFQEVTDKAAALEEKRKNANFLGKVAIYFKQNWELKLASKTIGATIALGSGVGAGAWLLRSLAGMAGGYMGGKWGRILGQKIGKKLFNKEGGRQVENITEKYIEGKISITEYQKRLEQLGLRANAVAALVGTAGAIGGGMGATIIEGAAVEGAHDALHTLHEHQHRNDLSPEEMADAQKILNEAREQALSDAQGGMSVEDQEKLIQNIHEEHVKSLLHKEHADTQSPETTATSNSVSETPITNATPDATTTPAPQPSHDIVIAVAEKGDGYIKLTEQLQEKLRAQYPDTDHAPQAVQDFLNKKAEAFTVEEKMLVYKDGTATSGMVHPGDKLTLDPDTGRIEIISKDGHVVSVLEDGDQATVETYTGTMGTEKTIEPTPEPSDSGATIDPTGEPEPARLSASDTATAPDVVPIETDGAKAIEATATNPTDNIERDEFGNPVTLESLNSTDASTTVPDTHTSEQVTPESVFADAAETHALLVDTTGYNPNAIAIAERYVYDLDAVQQKAFLDTYTSSVNTIFGYTVEGDYLENGFDNDSLWKFVYNKSLLDFKTAAEGMLERGEKLSVPAQNLYNHFYSNSTYDNMQSIMEPAPGLTIQNALALTVIADME